MILSHSPQGKNECLEINPTILILDVSSQAEKRIPNARVLDLFRSTGSSKDAQLKTLESMRFNTLNMKLIYNNLKISNVLILV